MWVLSRSHRDTNDTYKESLSLPKKIDRKLSQLFLRFFNLEMFKRKKKYLESSDWWLQTGRNWTLSTTTGHLWKFYAKHLSRKFWLIIVDWWKLVQACTCFLSKARPGCIQLWNSRIHTNLDKQLCLFFFSLSNFPNLPFHTPLVKRWSFSWMHSCCAVLIELAIHCTILASAKTLVEHLVFILSGMVFIVFFLLYLEHWDWLNPVSSSWSQGRWPFFLLGHHDKLYV